MSVSTPTSVQSSQVSGTKAKQGPNAKCVHGPKHRPNADSTRFNKQIDRLKTNNNRLEKTVKELRELLSQTKDGLAKFLEAANAKGAAGGGSTTGSNGTGSSGTTSGGGSSLGQTAGKFAQIIQISESYEAKKDAFLKLDPKTPEYQVALLELQDLQASRSFMLQTLSNMSKQEAENLLAVARNLRS